VSRKREALHEVASTWSRYEAGRAKWCDKTHESMRKRLKELSQFAEGKTPQKTKPVSLAHTLASLGVPSH
jgi:hypothetical protein